jgi:membrane protein YdbS with pleckstrin-like domain
VDYPGTGDPSPGDARVAGDGPSPGDAAAAAGTPLPPARRAADADPALWPGDVPWRGVSPRLLVIRRIAVGGWLLPVAAATIAVPAFTGITWTGWAIGLGGLAALAWWWRIVTRAVRSWGYAEREDDLLIRHGVLIRRLTVVPYGRMQFVDVRAGPLERALGLAAVRLHTAAASTDAFIPGLPSAEAGRLREKLAALGESRAAGL